MGVWGREGSTGGWPVCGGRRRDPALVRADASPSGRPRSVAARCTRAGRAASSSVFATTPADALGRRAGRYRQRRGEVARARRRLRLGGRRPPWRPAPATWLSTPAPDQVAVRPAPEASNSPFARRVGRRRSPPRRRVALERIKELALSQVVKLHRAIRARRREVAARLLQTALATGPSTARCGAV